MKRGNWVYLFIGLVSHKDNTVPQGTILDLDKKINTIQC